MTNQGIIEKEVDGTLYTISVHPGFPHGAAAALLMAVGKKVIQMCGRGNLSPRQTLLEVNDSLRADIPAGMFLSALYGVI